jgi:hypothetical protein
MIIYTEAFRSFAGFTGGGVPDNGVIIDAAGTYQLAPYTGNNVLLLQRTEVGDLDITTPAKYARLRILCFSAEGASLINATVHFTDGTSTTYINNYSLADWFKLLLLMARKLILLIHECILSKYLLTVLIS